MSPLSWTAVALLGIALPVAARLGSPRVAQVAIPVGGIGFGVAGIVA